jgi:hypothetical protein
VALLIVAAFSASLFLTIHYLAPTHASAAQESAAWLNFLIQWYLFWLIWVPLLGFLLNRTVRGNKQDGRPKVF